jgi:hypothetical protein
MFAAALRIEACDLTVEVDVAAEVSAWTMTGSRAVR